MTPIKKPNIILVVLDATRPDHLSCYGYRKNTSPFLSRFAKNATIYQNCISTSSWTLPSFASIFTGQYPSHHKVDINHPFLDGDFITLPEYLKSKGYITVGVSNNSWISDYTKFNRGFDILLKVWQYFQSDNDVASDRMVKKFSRGSFVWKDLLNNLIKGNFVRNTINTIYGRYFFKKKDYGATKINKLIRGWFSSNYREDNPLFLMIHYLEPHLKYEPPKKFKEMFLDKEMIKIANKVNQDAWSYICNDVDMSPEDFKILEAMYDAEIKYMDYRLSEMFSFLEESGVLDNSFIFITADHGENIGDHGLMDHQYCLYDTLIKVPLIVRFPDGDYSGTEVTEHVQTIDIFTTIIEYLEEEKTLENQLNGKSLFIENLNSNRATYSEYLYPQPRIDILKKKYSNFDPSHLNQGLKSIRVAENKFILSSKSNEELYNIKEDPGETKNIAREHPDLCKTLKRQLISELGGFCFKDRETVLEYEVKKRLESLGYLT